MFCATTMYEILITGPTGIHTCNRCIISMGQVVRKHTPVTDADKYRYRWTLTDEDGVEYPQFVNGTEVSIEKIHAIKCKELRLDPAAGHDLPKVRVLIKPGEKAFRKLQITQSAMNGNLGQVREVLEFQGTYILMDVDGSITITSDPNC